jgi:hypothetical protein
MWAGSVKEWLILVAERAAKSGGQSTLKLFEGLKDNLLELVEIMTTQSQKSRITKMLSSTSFQEKFDRSKEVVVSLKESLKSYLDQEALDSQEKILADIDSRNLEVIDKMQTMDSQLGDIKNLLEEQAAKHANKVVGDEEEALYVSIQDVCGCGDKCPSFKNLVAALETFFLKGQKVPPEVLRGLKIAIDPENTNIITKLQWIRFYRSWQESSLPIEDYLLKLAAEAPPTLFQSMTIGGKKMRNVMGSSFIKTPSFDGINAAASALQSKMASISLPQSPTFSSFMGKKTEEPVDSTAEKTEEPVDLSPENNAEAVQEES